MNLVNTSSPHIRGTERTDKIMKDVLIALLPTTIAGAYFFGMRALLVVLVSVISAMAGEFVWGLLTKKAGTVMDCSATVTGLLLALTLPASVPYWVPVAGSLFAVVVAKGICGGLGQNTFNPALAGRALLVLVCPVYLTRYLEAGTKLSINVPVDAVAGATPLHDMVMGTLPETSLMNMFIGNIGGCIGEVSALALLIGGAYLVIKKVISPRIPVAYLGTIAVLTLIFSKGECFRRRCNAWRYFYADRLCIFSNNSKRTDYLCYLCRCINCTFQIYRYFPGRCNLCHSFNECICMAY